MPAAAARRPIQRWRGLVVGALCWAGAFAQAADAPRYTAADYEKGALACRTAADLACEETNWRTVLRMRPDYARGMANLGWVLNKRDQHAEAVTWFQRAIEQGEGAYDLFAYYADSLARLGRVDEAIEWNYRCLEVLPRAVDVRGTLARQLVQKKRRYEALALLAAFDEVVQTPSGASYFDAQRISIESLVSGDDAARQETDKPLRLSRIEGHFFAPLTLGEARPRAFVVDTGATLTTLSDELLDKSRLRYRVLDGASRSRLADGRTVSGRVVSLERLRVGPHEVKNIRAFVCKACIPLLGQSLLASFDMKTEKQRGVEFLLLSPRSR